MPRRGGFTAFLIGALGPFAEPWEGSDFTDAGDGIGPYED
jgi:hypothetical protein